VGDSPQVVYIAEHGDTAWTQAGQHAGRRTCRRHLNGSPKSVIEPATYSEGCTSEVMVLPCSLLVIQPGGMR
jgi:hypothetical protein